MKNYSVDSEEGGVASEPYQQGGNNKARKKEEDSEGEGAAINCKME
jgi:hypothetical protein